MRLPIVSTLVVAIAVAAMIGLGLWQLDRRAQKEALLASYAANARLAETALSRGPLAESGLFRPVRATCSTPQPPTRSAGRSAEGISGYRFIVRCAEGFAVVLGVASDPRGAPRWMGGEVAGLLTYAPSSTSFIERLFRAAEAPTPMIVPPYPLAPGLAVSRAPDPASVPNNHLAYAVQWFAFAAIAVVVYLLAVRRRMRS